VLDGGLERSIQLAAAMDSRGYGRSGQVSQRERRAQAVLVLAGFAGVLVGLYGLFDSAAPRLLGWPMLAGGVLTAILGLRAAGRRSPRTAYRPDPWRWPEWLTAASGGVVAVTFLVWSPTALLLRTVPLTWPELVVVPTLAVLGAVGPALWTPPIPGSGRPRTAGAPQ
jgi:energy-coupling factor transport system permease protein